MSSSDGRDDNEHADNDNDSTSAVTGNNDAPPLSLPDEGTTCPCRQHCKDSGNNKKAMYLMSIGATHNDAPLFSFEMAPCLLLPKTSMCLMNTDFGIEIDCRATLYNILPSKIQFLRLEVSRVCNVLQRAHASTTPNAGELTSGSVAERGCCKEQFRTYE